MKAGTAQKLVLNMLSTLTMSRLGYLLGNRMGRVQTRNAKLLARAEMLLQSEYGVSEDVARRALEASGGELPVALISLKLGITVDEARKALADLRKVWGIDAPERVSIDAVSVFASMSDEALDLELSRHLRLVQSASPVLDVEPIPVQGQGGNHDKHEE